MYFVWQCYVVWLGFVDRVIRCWFGLMVSSWPRVVGVAFEKFDFAQWRYRSQWSLSEARLLLVENYSQWPALLAWNTVGGCNFSRPFAADFQIKTNLTSPLVSANTYRLASSSHLYHFLPYQYKHTLSPYASNQINFTIFTLQHSHSQINAIHTTHLQTHLFLSHPTTRHHNSPR